MYFKENLSIKINEIISDKHIFYAHLQEGNQSGKIVRKETLKEHTDLCIKYFYKIFNDKKLENIFLNFENNFLEEISYEGKMVFRRLLINTIAFHDTGKINPRFQNIKMKNPIGENIEAFSCIGSEHSMLSAVLYIDYFIDDILKLSKEDGKLMLLTIMMLNAYTICRHHSDLGNFDEFLHKFNEDEKGMDIIDIFKDEYVDIYNKGKGFSLSKNKMIKVCRYIKNKYSDEADNEKSIYLYAYQRLIYSLIVTSDFYATSEFMNKTVIDVFGAISDIGEFYEIYKDTEVYKKIREYEQNEYEKDKYLEKEENINVLRTEMFLDAERELLKNIDENIYFLEAPTGSGKSNTAFNLSFKLFEEDKNLKKIYYVYPFNTLVEQNLNILNKIFENNKTVADKIAVINSIYPIKEDEKYIKYRSKDKDEKDFNEEYYEKILLDRQFLNYPVILTTHVSLFNTMFGANKEDTFAFHQLANSVIVLDEIQSYKNTIWTEIISFLKGFAKILNIKVIIMSATLPDLNMLAVNKNNVCNLIKDREKYFSNPKFKDRVIVNYELIDAEEPLEALYEHVLKNSKRKKKILIEFIKKQSAYDFFKRLQEKDLNTNVLLMTGDDNSIERNKIINAISSKECEENGVILVATQVIEAGVDIDMDIGYKDISKLDSDEQFMGRINRSCKRSGEVYFFDLDRMDKIYKDDFRVNKEFSLLDDEMREILKNKDFYKYYNKVLSILKESNEALNDNNIDKFFKKNVWMLNFEEISERMKLINDDNWIMSVYLARKINYGEINLEGAEIWNEYKLLLQDNKMNFSEKQVKLSQIRSKMNFFIYEINKNMDLPYNDKIGGLYYIENGERYFENGKLDKEKFKKEVGMFIDL